MPYVFIHQELEQLSNITMLVLDHNLLRHLPPVIMKLPKLQILMSSNNNITYLPEMVGTCVQLQALILHSNQLMQVRTRVVDMPKACTPYFGNVPPIQ